MQNKYKINEEIELVTGLKELSEAYQEISVIKMQRIRKSVVTTREYLIKLSEVFFDVKASYQRKIEEIMKQKKLKVEKKETKKIAVLLSANSKLYGTIIQDVFKDFLRYVDNNNTDVMIIGRLGRELFEQSPNKRHYLYSEIPDGNVSLNDLAPVFFHLVKYESVNVFYGKFENVISQNAVSSNISGEEPFKVETAIMHTGKHYLFEPSLEEILKFFENETTKSLFKQTVDEAQLARHASRIRAMEEALIRIDERNKTLYIQRKNTTKHLENKKQLEAFAGVLLWQK